MPGMFCRHNRLTANCPICSRELNEEMRAKAPVRAKPAASRARVSAAPPRSGRLVTRKLARAADDGYRNPLVPGLRATADAERLAVALTQAARRLEYPGPHPDVAEEPDLEQATLNAFLYSLDDTTDRTLEAYDAWVARSGGTEAAFTGEPSWTPERRFGRIFERLAFPGMSRAARFELLTTLGSAGRYELKADGLHFTEDDATTTAAKRILV